ncbi:MAG: O-succinylhomoserine sulfhydrylase [Alphaproteobacteria bacterium]|nr:O-succinylhomoserine sulfhydrylase [Alphaproteobacteria bacterium]
MKSDQTSWRPATRAVRGGQERSGFSETSEALYLTSGYVYGSAEEAAESFDGTRHRYVYSRFANPTVTTFEARLALIEGAEACRATATGMAAVNAALFSQLSAGDRVVSSRALFSSCQYILSELLPRFGVTVDFVPATDAAAWERALATPAKAVFLETPSNPTLEIVDLAAISTLAHRAGARLVVDNALASPALQSPLALGADVVVYSATKHIDGQGRCLGGAVLADRAFCDEILLPYMRHTGPAMSPFNAWVLLKGLETLDLRVNRHAESALALARFLESRPEVERVIHPGLESHPQHELAMRQMRAGGTMVTFTVGGGRERAFRLLNALRLIDISNNLGDAKTLITHPATTTHHRLGAEERDRVGIGEGMLRLSVGLEDVLDLEDDLKRALAA